MLRDKPESHFFGELDMILVIQWISKFVTDHQATEPFSEFAFA